MLHLASQSPRRRELLARLGLPFGQIDVDVPEVRGADEPAADYVLRVAGDKARAGLQALGGGAETLVLGADTEVVLDGVVFGKPRDDADAMAMLRTLSGRRHEVISAVVVVGEGRIGQLVVVTGVTFDTLDDATIAAYVATGEPRGKAGAYAIQGGAELFVARMDGSYSGVVGLPLQQTAALLRTFGLHPQPFASDHGA
ncbi:septum formation inhibitor Maf [Luteimonas chenhongjianii]|uniref:dTTP/UTP pyrophosphatase n=1 Tax=Luteimonas chenhongjianii TaxID=2006110 RepID=A0A290XFX8_9GAMM|nr:Maf family protein [Luteimonas chenhongjianii]ATD68062.1 septum formation inhibitor Maf [Luteimonas chenhongjianii]